MDQECANALLLKIRAYTSISSRMYGNGSEVYDKHAPDDPPLRGFDYP